MVQRLRALFDGLTLRCPRCHAGRMFERGFSMRRSCPLCGLEFERSAGEITGGMSINTVVTLLVMIGLLVAFPDIAMILPKTFGQQ